MGKREKFLERLLLGQSDANTDFDDLCALLRELGFEERIKGSHHISDAKPSTNASICNLRASKPRFIKFGKFETSFCATDCEANNAQIRNHYLLESRR